METSARLFHCAHCFRQVIVCSCCDRSNIYCCPECSQLARKKSLRDAGKRYQSSLKGRHKHANRQRHYRQRLAKKIKIVTHHTSPVLSDDDLLLQQPGKQKRLSQSVICHFCGNCCSTFLRSSFLCRRISNKVRYFSSWPGGP